MFVVRSAGRWSTARVYHDPRYDRLATCPRCGGHGCPRCSQTGRITRAARDRPPVPERTVAEPAVPDWTARDWVVQDRAAREWAARTRSRSGPDDDGDRCERAWSRR